MGRKMSSVLTMLGGLDHIVLTHLASSSASIN